jgi:hypothetical protein
MKTKLIGWKAIASVVGVSVMHAHNLAKREKHPLPVHSLGFGTQVWAFYEDLIEWHNTTPTIRDRVVANKGR